MKEVVFIDNTTIYAAQVQDNISDDESLIQVYQNESNTTRSFDRNHVRISIHHYSENVFRVDYRFIPDPDICLCITLPPFDIVGWWASAYPILEVIATTTGAITGAVATVGAPFVFIKWLRNVLRNKKNQEEYDLLQLILKQNTWHPLQLSLLLSLPIEQAKNLLRGFGFIWNSRKSCYEASDQTKELRKLCDKYSLK